MERDWKRVFEDTFEGPPSTVERRVWREVFGNDYPNGLDPYSFITQPELERFAAEAASIDAMIRRVLVVATAV